jgi:hypothetical protein
MEVGMTDAKTVPELRVPDPPGRLITEDAVGFAFALLSASCAYQA